MNVKKLLNLILIMAVIILPMSVAADTSSELVAVASESPTPDTNWYNVNQQNFFIQNADQLAGLAELVNSGNDFYGKTINLVTDIDLSSYGANFNDGRGWIPIGTTGIPHMPNHGIPHPDFPTPTEPQEPYWLILEGFRGRFNGNNRQITGLYINNPDGYSIGFEVSGLFGMMSGWVENLNLVDVNITGRYRVGGLAGELGRESVAWGISVTGVINGENAVGGIAGVTEHNVLRNSAFSGTVSGIESIGGLVGSAISGSHINVSHTAGVINGNLAIGGLIGYLSGANAFVTNSYSTAIINGDVHIGGIVGLMGGSVYFTPYYRNIAPIVSNNLISSFTATDSSSVQPKFSDGISMTTQSTSRILNSYSTSVVSGNEGVGGLAGTITINGFPDSRPVITDSAALNPSVIGYVNVGRIVGGGTELIGDIAYLSRNQALETMVIRQNNESKTPLFIGCDQPDGADICINDVLRRTFWIGLSDGENVASWQLDVWDFEDNRLPILLNVGGEQSGDASHLIPEEGNGEDNNNQPPNRRPSSGWGGIVVDTTPIGNQQEEQNEQEVDVEDNDENVVASVTEQFADISDDDWFFNYVQSAIENGLLNGVSETEFAPSATATRAMFVTVLWRMAGRPMPEGTVLFHDIANQDWFFDAVRWAAENEIVGGVGNGQFAPNTDITREQVAVIIHRSLEILGLDGFATQMYFIFEDADEISVFANNAIQTLANMGLMSGNPDGTFNPQGSLTRAEMAAVLQRISK